MFILYMRPNVLVSVEKLWTIKDDLRYGKTPKYAFSKKKLSVQSHSANLCTVNSFIFFEENWNLKVKAVHYTYVNI